MWITINKDTPLPKESGTKAVVYMGVTAWFYWNVDDKKWHPIHGWRRIVGYPFTDMTAYMELPKYQDKISDLMFADCQPNKAV